MPFGNQDIETWGFEQNSRGAFRLALPLNEHLNTRTCKIVAHSVFFEIGARSGSPFLEQSTCKRMLTNSRKWNKKD